MAERNLTQTTLVFWRSFREQYENYEIVSDLADKSQEKHVAVFLTRHSSAEE